MAIEKTEKPSDREPWDYLLDCWYFEDKDIIIPEIVVIDLEKTDNKKQVKEALDSPDLDSYLNGRYLVLGRGHGRGDDGRTSTVISEDGRLWGSYGVGGEKGNVRYFNSSSDRWFSELESLGDVYENLEDKHDDVTGKPIYTKKTPTKKKLFNIFHKK